jgi:DnaJ-class molecular chaperone
MDISLNSGERICDKCNGEGIIVIENIKILEKCKHCNGEKSITWIDDVIGEK